jgi:hypothetical protein
MSTEDDESGQASTGNTQRSPSSDAMTTVDTPSNMMLNTNQHGYASTGLLHTAQPTMLSPSMMTSPLTTMQGINSATLPAGMVSTASTTQATMTSQDQWCYSNLLGGLNVSFRCNTQRHKTYYWTHL